LLGASVGAGIDGQTIAVNTAGKCKLETDSAGTACRGLRVEAEMYRTKSSRSTRATNTLRAKSEWFSPDKATEDEGFGPISKLYAALFGFRMLPIMAMSKSGQVGIVSDHHQRTKCM
jgi:hypothetical protein